MAGSGGTYTRFVMFSKVMLGPGWEQSDPFRYWHRYSEDSSPSSITITRSDGKVLSFDVSGDFTVQIIGENVIMFEAAPDEPAGKPFQ